MVKLFRAPDFLSIPYVPLSEHLSPLDYGTQHTKQGCLFPCFALSLFALKSVGQPDTRECSNQADGSPNQRRKYLHLA